MKQKLLTLQDIVRMFLAMLANTDVNKHKQKNLNRVLCCTFTFPNKDLLLSIDDFGEKRLAPIVKKFINKITYSRKQVPKYKLPNFKINPCENAHVSTLQDYHAKITAAWDTDDKIYYQIKFKFNV